MKKIDIEKSTVYGTNDKDNAIIRRDNVDLWLGIKGYFSRYRDFRTYVEGNLDGFTRTDFMSIQEHSEGYFESQWYDYFIPKDKTVFILEPKKLRPYKTIEEFKTETKKFFSIGDILLIRERKTGCVSELLYCGYTVVVVGGPAVDCEDTVVETKEYIHLGSNLWTLEKLSNYDFCINDSDWFAFGVEEND